MRVPALANWRARTLSWAPLDAAHEAVCMPLVSESSGHYEVAYGSDGNTIAYFRTFSTEAGCVQKRVPIEFIKLIPPQYYEHQAHIVRLEKALAAQRVHVPVLKRCLSLTQGNHAFVYDWMEGVAPECTAAQLTAIGHALAQLHTALLNASDDFQMVAQTRVRLARYQALAYDERFDQYWQGSGVEKFVLKKREEFLSALQAMGEGAAPCHGDLNPGNMLMLGDGGVAFLDLEDATHTVVWPGFDLAKVIERLVLPCLHEGAIDMAQAALHNRALLTAYLEAGGATSVRPEEVGQGRLAAALRWHMGLAVLILSTPATPKSLAHAEVQKFVEIEQLIRRFEAIL